MYSQQITLQNCFRLWTICFTEYLIISIMEIKPKTYVKGSVSYLHCHFWGWRFTAKVSLMKWMVMGNGGRFKQSTQGVIQTWDFFSSEISSITKSDKLVFNKTKSDTRREMVLWMWLLLCLLGRFKSPFEHFKQKTRKEKKIKVQCPHKQLQVSGDKLNY